MNKSLRVFLWGIFLISFIGFTSSCGKEDPFVPEAQTVPCDSLQLSMDYDPDEGTLTVIATGGNEPYNYTWLNDSTAAVNSCPLPIDTVVVSTIEVDDAVSYYQVLVTDAEGCEQEATYEFAVDPCESLQVSIWFWADFGSEAGVSVSGGVEPYTYQWSNGQTSSLINTDNPGTYSVAVVDAQGCLATADITLSATDIDPCLDWKGIFYWDFANGTLSFGDGTDELLYEWWSGETEHSIFVSESGEYDIDVSFAEVHGEDLCWEKEFSVELTIDDMDLPCNDEVSLSAATVAPLDFLAESEAYLYKDFCVYGPYDHSYVIVDVTWDFPAGFSGITAAWGGMPGFTFGSVGAPVVGQTYDQYSLGNHRTFFGDFGTQLYIFDDVHVTITETGNSLGENIAGTLNGTVYTEFDTGNVVAITGEFCVPIVAICLN